jgi:flagellar hook protein FlgE
MLRSMYTAISSLNLNQNYLDVVASNLANANTIGFKASRFMFQDQFSQMMSPGSAPTTTSGGMNPTQVGLGSQVGYISPNFLQGALQATGRNLDLAMQGDGFFIYGTGAERRYSREGSLALDSNGKIVNSSTGLRVQGWKFDATTGKVDPNSTIGDIDIPTGQAKAKATTAVTIGGNLNVDNTVNKPNDKITVTVGAYDALGNQVPVKVVLTRKSDTVWSYDINGTTADLDFGTTGKLPAGTTVGPVTITGGTGAPTFPVTFDFSNLTMQAAANTASVTSQDGLASGTVSDVYITPNDGAIYLVYSNGMREQLGQVAVARFTNPEGLIQSGHTMFQVGLNSGDPQLGAAGTGGRGAIAAGYLEGSNVDMAQEFTNMIMAQRGFQASSRVITTSDEIMQELVNLKR